MDKIMIYGGKPLKGRIKVSGAKNAVLPILAGSLLAAQGTSKIEDVPALDDVQTILQVLRELNVEVDWQPSQVKINATKSLQSEASYELVSKMRASVLVMGPLLARTGHARVALPGGCAIGSRPIDQHLKGFEALGAQITLGNGFVEAKAEKGLTGAKVYLDIPSVGATENIMMAATLAKGTTIIDNAAKEPEIVDLAQYLNAMGARIIGAGTGSIRIEGVSELKGTKHAVIPDRIEAGTYMIAAAISRSNLFVEGAVGDHLYPLVAKLTEMGVEIDEQAEGIMVYAQDKHLRAVDIKTLPYPGFPTDLQAQMMALLCTVDGNSVVAETVFENRFMHVEELKRMNAGIKVEGQSAFIDGNTVFTGSKVAATDLRAGAALILAGLVAEGTTEVTNLHHVDRGYDNIVAKLAQIGADIERYDAEGNSVAVERHEIDFTRLALNTVSIS